MEAVAVKQQAHTPGPWESIGSVVRDKRDANGNGGFMIADCLRGEAHEESHANAALVAAAPDLLAALLKAWDSAGPLDADVGQDAGVVISGAAFDAIRAAIAKATA